VLLDDFGRRQGAHMVIQLSGGGETDRFRQLAAGAGAVEERLDQCLPDRMSQRGKHFDPGLHGEL
jgi:hypothetical protein